jgi:insulysin
LVKDYLNEYLYSAEIAGAGYDIDCHIQGLLLVLRGYNDKLQILLEKIIIEMKNFKVDPERFLLIKERLQREYKNSLLEEPFRQSGYYLGCILNEKLWTVEEKLEALQNIRYEDIEIFYPDLLNQLFFESLIHGNTLKDDAMKILQKVEETFQSEALVPSVSLRTAIIPEGRNFVYQTNVFDMNNINSAIEYYIQVGDLMNKELRTKLRLAAQITTEPCFNQLRTNEQLGKSSF